MSSEIDYLLKILILGDSSVGKTSILLKFCDDKFNPNHMPTIGNYLFNEHNPKNVTYYMTHLIT